MPFIKKVVNRKRKPTPEMQKCDCPICPIVEYGLNIQAGDVWVSISEPDKNNQIECSLHRDKKIPRSLSDNFINLILFARNNHNLPIDSALEIDVGNAVINIARPLKNLYALKVCILPDLDAHAPEIEIYEITD